MRYQVTRIRDLNAALRDIKKFMRSGAFIHSGRGANNFGRMLPRELVANWLLCAVCNFDRGSNQFTYTTDPYGRDGIIFDKATGHTWPTEHVFVPKSPSTLAETEILLAIQSKNRGKTYASGLTLVVFLGGVGNWFPNKLAKQLPKPLDFDDVWVIGLWKKAKSIYDVVQLDGMNGSATMWRVHIARNFKNWWVERIALHPFGGISGTSPLPNRQLRRAAGAKQMRAK